MVAKSFIVSMWPRAQERAPEWLKNCQQLQAGRGSGRSPVTRGIQRGPSKAPGLRRLLVVFESEAFQELLAGPSMGAAQQAE